MQCRYGFLAEEIIHIRHIHHFNIHIITFTGTLTNDAAGSVGQHGEAALAADVADPGDKCSLLLKIQALELRLGWREEVLNY